MGPCSEACTEGIGPLVGGFEDHPFALSPDADLALSVREAEFVGQADGLAAAVPEELGAKGLHSRQYRHRYIRRQHLRIVATGSVRRGPRTGRGHLYAIIRCVTQRLAKGVYEHLVTEALERDLAVLEPEIRRAIELLSEADGHLALVRHLGQEVARVLGSLPQKERLEVGRELVSRLIGDLASLKGIETDGLADQQIPKPARRLMAIHRGAVPERPATPLAVSTLLTRNRAEPSLGHELAREIAIADRVDAVVAFVTVSGVRAILDALDTFVRRGDRRRMRLLTTVFSGITEVTALDHLGRLPGVEIKVSHDVRRTRLHAKAWLFHRDSGLTTAYVGSANLTSTALGGGQEWMVKLCAADLQHVIEKFAGTFETLWQAPSRCSVCPCRLSAR
jgi:HKD family nuclease